MVIWLSLQGHTVHFEAHLTTHQGTSVRCGTLTENWVNPYGAKID